MTIGFRVMPTAIGNRFALGLVLHTGPRPFRMDESIAALPICALCGLQEGGELGHDIGRWL